MAFANTIDLGRIVGRGGAGNWHVENKEKDVEAQKEAQASAQISAALAQAQAQQPPAPYTRAGRGGAGNVYDAASVAAAARDDEATRLRVTMGQTTAKPSGAAASPTSPVAKRYHVSGRGGAGNWAAHQSAAAAEEAAKERRKAEALEAQVLQEVDAELAMPPRTYHKTVPEKEGRGENLVEVPL